MGKKVLRTLLFFAGFVILFACFNHLLAPKTNTAEAGMHDSHAKGFVAEPQDTLDVLYLGDSEVYRAVMPLKIWEEQGITGYACGTNEQRLYQTEMFLYRALQQQSPKLVFLETNCIYQDHSTLDVIPHRLEEIFPLIRYHDRWKNMNLSDFTQPIQLDTVVRDKGYVYINYSYPMVGFEHMIPTEDVSPIPGKNIRHVQKLQEMCREKGAELVLFSTPSTMNWSYSRHNAMVQLAEDLGVAYIDMNLLEEEIPIDWSKDTMDEGDHMNYFGAQKVSHYLGQYLAEQGLFADKRTLPEYAAWNEALADFYGSIPEAQVS